METTTYFCSKQNRMRKIILGLMLITSGILLLAFNAGLIDHAYKHIIFSWQMLLIAIGFLNLFKEGHSFSGIVLMLIGTFFILPQLFFLPENFEINFWPGLLIIIGILIIARRTIFHKHFNKHQFQSTSELKNDAGYIVLNNIFGGGKHRIPPTEFKGGKISNIFGGTELDLTQATLAPGTNVLEVNCIFGGASIIVPTDWVVTVQVTSIMGGFNDKRPIIRNSTTNPSDRELIIKGSAIFGGGDVKSY
jgi:predicted membrane protein